MQFFFVIGVILLLLATFLVSLTFYTELFSAIKTYLLFHFKTKPREGGIRGTSFNNPLLNMVIRIYYLF